MDESKEVEHDGANDVAAENEAMVVDNEKEMEGGKEQDLPNDSVKQSTVVENEKPVEGKDEELQLSQKDNMGIDIGRPAEYNDGQLARCKEEGKKTIESKQDNFVAGSDKSFHDMSNDSVKEKGSMENSSSNQSTFGENMVPEVQLLGTDIADHIHEKKEEASSSLTGVESSVQDGARKEGPGNALVLDHLVAKEGLNNGVKMKKMEDSKGLVSVEQSRVCDAVTGEPATLVKEKLQKPELDTGHEAEMKTPSKSFIYETDADGYESGTEEEQVAFVKELEAFHKERGLDFKPPKFYQEKLNLLKLWRSVIKLGGYEQVTSCKLWRQVGESFKPPKTCTTVSWTFRGFYEKSLLEFEKHKILSGELPEIDASLPGSTSVGTQAGVSQGPASGRTRRDAAARAMQGWHSMRLLSNGEVGDPIIKDKNSISLGKREKQLKSIGLLKRRKESPIEHAAKVGHLKSSKPQSETMVVDIGAPAEWVKVNVQRTKDCFEVYALVPGLLREEVRVQSDPAGRLVISGQPEQLDNPWGVTPFKKVVSLPSRIDPHQTSAVVTLHGQLYVRVPFEQSDS